MDLARTILDTVEDLQSQGIEGNSVIISQLIKLAKREPKSRLAEVEEKIYFDPIVDEKIRVCREMEINGDLCWMEYYSWNNLPKETQEEFVQVFDPLMFTGVFFSYSKYKEMQFDLLRDIDERCVVFTLRDENAFQVACVSSDWDPCEFLGIMKFRDYRKKFNARLINSIGKSRGQLVYKEYSIGK